jgi:2-oxo-3-hexenedioate decarboxylase
LKVRFVGTEEGRNDLAAQVLAAAAARTSIPPFTQNRPDFDLREAYAVSALVTERRIARGERPVGWKIGFTNTTIWDEYGVHAPIWGPMFDTTVQSMQGGEPCSLTGLLEPRIEPEIIFRLARAPEPGMDERAILGCIDAVAHGFEIVQSLFPDWRFQAADTVAAFALHGRLRHGPLIPPPASRRRNGSPASPAFASPCSAMTRRSTPAWPQTCLAALFRP